MPWMNEQLIVKVFYDDGMIVWLYVCMTFKLWMDSIIKFMWIEITWDRPFLSQ